MTYHTFCNNFNWMPRGYFNMINNFIDLFLAGMETTSTSLLWTFLYLLHHPDIKEKIHQELDTVSIDFELRF